MQLRRATLATMLLAVLTAFPMPAPAQNPGGVAAPQSGQPLRITPEKVDAFADAALVVTGIGAIWQPKINAAGSKEEAQKIIAQVRDEMRQAVEDTPGITMAEYLAITRAARDNPKLAVLIRTRMEEKQAAQAARAARGAK